MVSRSNLEGRGGYIKQAQKAAKANKPAQTPSQFFKIANRGAQGGIIGSAKRAAKRAAKANKPNLGSAQSPGTRARVSEGGLLGVAGGEIAGPAGAAARARRGGMVNTVGQLRDRQNATQQEQPAGQTRQNQPLSDEVVGFMERQAKGHRTPAPESERTLATNPDGSSPYARHIQQRYKQPPATPEESTSLHDQTMQPSTGFTMPKKSTGVTLGNLPQNEPNLGGTQTRNGVTEPTLNRSRASRSRRTIR